ncbi:MAG: hypothetical protein OXF74_08340 [Rhodobacteraceae bacterium]|nr:hypothetical protein [Paracoccaceae bacterium]
MSIAIRTAFLAKQAFWSWRQVRSSLQADAFPTGFFVYRNGPDKPGAEGLRNANHLRA